MKEQEQAGRSNFRTQRTKVNILESPTPGTLCNCAAGVRPQQRVLCSAKFAMENRSGVSRFRIARYSSVEDNP